VGKSGRIGNALLLPLALELFVATLAGDAISAARFLAAQEGIDAVVDSTPSTCMHTLQPASRHSCDRRCAASESYVTGR